MRMSKTIIPYVATTTLLLLAAGCTPQKILNNQQLINPPLSLNKT
ncbi:exported hypothetical protein [Latilactobacillus curvatus]|nr:exported hypothetical protein [Latilactobacillus curvatus]